MQPHTLKAFDTDIDSMRLLVARMGFLVESQVSRAVQALQDSDLRLVSQVLIDEASVNQMQVQADLLCNQVLLRRQPLAFDLREVVGAIHAVSDLERIGDEAKKIALKARDLDRHAARGLLPFDRVRDMGVAVSALLRQAVDAYERHDARQARDMVARDVEVDRLRDVLRDELYQRMGSEASVTAAAMDLVLVIQSLERIGDHAKNLSEYVIHVVEGVDLRHARSQTDAAPDAVDK